MESIGLKPCVNRLHCALLHSAYQLLSDGVVSLDDIDNVKHGLGLR